MTHTHAEAAKKAGFNKNIWKSIIIFGLIMWIASIAQYWLPVVILPQEDIIEVTDDYALLSMSFVKILNCQYVAGSERGYARIKNGRWEPITAFKFEEQTDLEYTHPRSFLKRANSGWWRWDWSENKFNESYDEVTMFVQHSCDGGVEYVDLDTNNPKINITGDLRWTEVGPFKLSQE